MKRPPAWVALLGGLVLFAISFYIGHHGRHSATAAATSSAHVAAHTPNLPPTQ